MNAASPFAPLPATARLWIYAADAPLSADDQSFVRQTMDGFLADWTSHGQPVNGAFRIRDDRFLMLAAALDAGEISGCGIDASVHALEDAAAARGIAWIPALHVIYRDADGRVQHVARPAFRRLAERGSVTAETPVFDPSLTTLAALRAGQFERPAGTAWHAQAFDLRQPA